MCTADAGTANLRGSSTPASHSCLFGIALNFWSWGEGEAVGAVGGLFLKLNFYTKLISYSSFSRIGAGPATTNRRCMGPRCTLGGSVKRTRVGPNATRHVMICG